MSWFKKHKILTVIIGLVLVIAVVSSASGSKSGTTDKKASGSASQSTKTTAKTETPAKIGDVARDGKFEFVVKSVKCGESSVTASGGYLSKSAQGQYCLMDISVKNIGDKQQYFSESDQKLLNASGVEYSSDSTATLYNSNNSDVWLSQINPGNTVEGTLVYDIPKDQAPVTAEFHDSAFSDGVKISLQ